jgi:DNA-binding NtrC family response regulator
MGRHPLTDREAPSKDQTDEAIQPDRNHPAPSLIPRKESSAEIEKWTWKKFFERGLGHAGVALWEWRLKTDDLEILSGFGDSKDSSPLPSLTKWERIAHEEDRDRLLEALRTFESTSYSALDCFFRLATQEPRWVHARDMQVSLDAKGQPESVFGIFFDDTESEISKEELFWGQEFSVGREDNGQIRLIRALSERSRHEKDGRKIANLMNQCYHEFMSLFSFSDLPAFRKNADLRYLEVNRAMEKLLGMPAEEILKLTDEEIWGQATGERLRSLCMAVLGGQTVLWEKGRILNGVRLQLLDQLFPDWGKNGRIVGICGVMSPRPVDPILEPDRSHEKARTYSLMQSVYLQIQLAAQYDCNVMLTGESGTGKDYLARQLHDLSKRSDGPFENFNCAALQKELAGSELFGHEAGAFTGAKAMRRGIFELAAKGTVFLNEIGDMPLDLQPRLLTILETRSFRRVGGEKTVALGARIIAATNVDLNKEVEEGRFRKDLYHRLTVFSIRVPPLRERLGELPALVENLTQKIAEDMGLENVPELDRLVMRKLREYHWPGNIRELRNVLERAFIHSQGSLIGHEHIVFESKDTVETRTLPNQAIRPERETPLYQSGEERRSDDRPRKPSQQEIRQLYQKFIVENGWTRARLADRLGVHCSTLKKWFKAAGLEAGKRGRPMKGS